MMLNSVFASRNGLAYCNQIDLILIRQENEKHEKQF